MNECTLRLWCSAAAYCAGAIFGYTLQRFEMEDCTFQGNSALVTYGTGAVQIINLTAKRVTSSSWVIANRNTFIGNKGSQG
jgi:hypothetical protein